MQVLDLLSWHVQQELLVHWIILGGERWKEAHLHMITIPYGQLQQR